MIQHRHCHRRLGPAGLFLAALLGAAALPAQAQTILSSNLSSPSGGVDTATGTNWLSVSFNTNASAYTLNNVTLLLANSSAGAGTAEVDIYTDGGLQPGTLLGALTSPGSISTTLADTTFTTSGLSLAANSTYWTVLKANTGSFNLSFANDDASTGSGFTDTYGNSADAGATWFTFTGFPYQMSVTATAAVPEPGTIALLASGSLFGTGLLLRCRARSRRSK